MVLAERRKKVQDIRGITGKPPGDERLVRILLTIMDKDTKTTFPTLRDKVRAYATLMGGNPSQKGPALMDIDQIGKKESEENWPENENLGDDE